MWGANLLNIGLPGSNVLINSQTEWLSLSSRVNIFTKSFLSWWYYHLITIYAEGNFPHSYPMQSWASILANSPGIRSQTSFFKQCSYFAVYECTSYRGKNAGSGNERHIPSSWNFTMLNQLRGKPHFPTDIQMYLDDSQWWRAGVEKRDEFT